MALSQASRSRGKAEWLNLARRWGHVANCERRSKSATQNFERAFALLEGALEGRPDALNQLEKATSAILFGSRAKGTHTRASDVDLAVAATGWRQTVSRVC